LLGHTEKPLTAEAEKHNHTIGSQRVMIEHIIREIKIFKIVAERYRNRRKRFYLCLNLIEAICKPELKN
jgi:hypothetical protein